MTLRRQRTLFETLTVDAAPKIVAEGNLNEKRNACYKNGDITMANFKNGVIRDGSSIGSGRSLGNIKDGIVRDGSSKGAGRALGNVKNGIVRDGSSPGSGKALFNVKGDIVKNGSSPGAGSTLGKIKDYNIKGMERELDEEIVAAFHFLVKKIV